MEFPITLIDSTSVLKIKLLLLTELKDQTGPQSVKVKAVSTAIPDEKSEFTVQMIHPGHFAQSQDIKIGTWELNQKLIDAGIPERYRILTCAASGIEFTNMDVNSVNDLNKAYSINQLDNIRQPA